MAGASFKWLAYNGRMATTTAISDADVLEHVVSTVNGGIPPEAARALLEMQFDKDATKTIRRLLQKHNRGAISAEERITLERFVRVGKLVDLIHAKARQALMEASRSR
jgi:hypothetical protein